MRFTPKHALVRALSVTLVLSLAACGGGGGTTNALPGGSTPLAAGKAVVKIALTVPSATMKVHRRSPKYIAPTTKGFGFDLAASSSALNPAQPTVAVNFANPAAPSITVDTYGGSSVSCANNPDGSATCAFALTVPTSTTPYLLQVSTFDSAPSSTGTTFNSADLLSQQTFTGVSVAEGVPTTPLALVLDGVPASTELVPMPNQVHLQPNGGGYTLIGMTPVEAHIYALDRDGNIIVGDGAPQICVQSPTDPTTGSPYVSVSVSSPGTGPSGQTCDNAPTTAPIWTLQTKSWSASPLSLTLNAVASGPSPTGGTGAAAATSVSLSEEQEVWVGMNTGFVQVAGYGFTPSSTSGTPGTLSPIASDTGGGSGANSLFGSAFDPKSGTLWIGGLGTTAFIAAFTPSVGAAPFPSLPLSSIAPSAPAALVDANLAHPQNMAVDSAQRLWVVDPQYVTGASIIDYSISNPATPTGPVSTTTTTLTFGGGLALDPGTEGDGRPPTLWLSGMTGPNFAGNETIFAYNISTGTPTAMTVNGAPSISGSFSNGIAVSGNGQILLDEDSSAEKFGVYQSSYNSATGQYTLTQPVGIPNLITINAAGINVFSLAATYPNASGLYDVLIGGTYLTGSRGGGALLDCASGPSAFACPTTGQPGYNSQPPLNAATTVVVVP